MAPPVELQPGDDLAGRYRLVRRLGEGGMGVVWEATQTTTGKTVAIKVLKSSMTGTADGARFVREAKMAARLSHRNIVQVFDYWEVPAGAVFLVMEFLVGETLATLLARRGALPAAEVAALLGPAANALGTAHGLGVVHRDVKPENLFVARSGDQADIKVLDFGLAKPIVADAQITAVTQSGSLMGTPFYMSPEQVYGEKTIDASSDVWSLGVVLYECLSGEKPFIGENFGQIFRAITQTTPRRLGETSPAAQPELDALVHRMLSHDREQRPSMTEVTNVLALVSGAPPSTNVAPPQVETLQITQALPTPPRIPQTATMLAAVTSVNETPKSKRRFALVGVVGVALSLVVAVVWLQRSRPTVDTSPPQPLATSVAFPTPAPTPSLIAPIEAPDASSPKEAPRATVARPAVTAKKEEPRPSKRELPPTPSSRDPLGSGRF